MANMQWNRRTPTKEDVKAIAPWKLGQSHSPGMPPHEERGFVADVTNKGYN